MKTFEKYLEKMGYSWNDFDRTYEMENLIEQYADEKVKQALPIPDVGLSLPDEDEINSMRLELDCPTPNEEEYTTAGFKSGVRWLA